MRFFKNVILVVIAIMGMLTSLSMLQWLFNSHTEMGILGIVVMLAIVLVTIYEVCINFNKGKNQ